ncbi:MAG: glycosyltransferase family 4 protein [Spirochaetes bacterium]|nr:glycosyltransferase family 4 protein [Spirochaetota bacterium]
MKKIKILLQYPWKISDSQYYKSLIENPPKNIEYLSETKKVGMITSKYKFLILNSIKKYIRLLFEKLNLSIPNSHNVSTKKNYDIVHFAHCLGSKNTKKPWVADFESLWQMWISGKNNQKGVNKVRDILKQKECKKIMCWTETARKEIISKFPEIKEKTETVSFAIPSPKFKKQKKDNINLLFISRYFYEKGGLHAIEAIDQICKKYSFVNAIIVSTVPKEILKKYKSNKKIKFFELMPHEKIIKKIYPFSDILIYPGYSDSFGFVFIESMSFGIPIITVDGFARKDIIENGKTGFVIKRPDNFDFEKEIKDLNSNTIKLLIEKASILIENKKLRNKMSKNCIKEVKNGKFSIKERNKKLEKIYKESIIN